MLKGKLPSEVVNERHQYMNALKQFIEEQRHKLHDVLQQLDLTEDFLSKVEPRQSCPFDPNHFVPEKSFKKHVEKCRLLKAGCQEDELASQLQNTDFCYEGKNSMKIELDESLMNKIMWDACVQNGEVYTGHRTMPVSHIDESINLTQNDRLAIYRYVVNKSHEAGKVIPVDKTDELLTTDWGSLVKKGLLNTEGGEKYSSKLEQLAALRDLKRRRQSYRAKNVHITKKSYTEIIREVIENQMEVLVPANAEKNVDDVDYDEHKSRHKSRKRRERDEDRDSQSRRSRSRDREKRRRYNQNEKEDEWLTQNEEGNTSRKCLDSQSQRPMRYDLDCIKTETTSNLQVDSTNNNDSINAMSSSREINSSNIRNANDSRRKTRSISCSSSQSSDESRHHKKSKHKKKSKHSKKHSKKHKR